MQPGADGAQLTPTKLRKSVGLEPPEVEHSKQWKAAEVEC